MLQPISSDVIRAFPKRSKSSCPGPDRSISEKVKVIRPRAWPQLISDEHSGQFSWKSNKSTRRKNTSFRPPKKFTVFAPYLSASCHQLSPLAGLVTKTPSIKFILWKGVNKTDENLKIHQGQLIRVSPDEPWSYLKEPSLSLCCSGLKEYPEHTRPFRGAITVL